MSEAGFEQTWRAEVLEQAPLIAPARQLTWPVAIAGEEDAMARGALRVMVRPGEGEGAAFLASCALGFTDQSMPSGVWACPRTTEICVVAGGYAYVADVRTPGQCTQIALRPVVAVEVAAEARLLLFVGFHTIVAWGEDGRVWESGRLSWDGVRVESVAGGEIRGLGWDLVADEEVPFRVELATGRAAGGGYRLEGRGV